MDIDEIVGKALERADALEWIGSGETLDRFFDFGSTVESLASDCEGLSRVNVEMLAEELVAWWCVANRLEQELGENDMMVSGTGTTPPRVHAAHDALAKTRERMKKVMKELIEKLEAESATEGKGLASLVQDLMKRTEDVFEDAVRPRRDQTKTEEEQGEPEGHRLGNRHEIPGGLRGDPDQGS